jgi:hypothetical protein
VLLNQVIFSCIFGGPVLEARDFQSDIIQCVAERARAKHRLHIANPRRDVSRSKSLTNKEFGRWQAKHQALAAQMGKRGVMLFYASSQLGSSLAPAENWREFTNINDATFATMAEAKQPDSTPAQVVLGIDPTHPLYGLNALMLSAAENNVPIYDGLYRACGAAAAMLFDQPAGGV